MERVTEMPDLHDRFRSLDHLTTPDQWTEITDRAARAPASARRPSWGVLAFAAVAVLTVAIGAGLAAGGFVAGPSPAASESPAPPAGPNEPVTASVTNGDYRLTVTSPRWRWGSSEPITVTATLEYLGSAPSVILSGSGAGLIGFGVAQLDGDLHMEPAFTSDCAPHEITPTAPITTPFTKSGGYSPDDPRAAFWEYWFSYPELDLPNGQWQITASATFDVGSDCTATPIQMSVPINLTVAPGGSPQASAPPTAYPSPVETSSASEPPFTCGLTITSAPDSNDIRHLTDVQLRQVVGGGRESVFDRVVFQYAEAGIPGFEIRTAEPPLTRDPSGQPLTLYGEVQAVYQIVISGGTKVDPDGHLTYTGPTDIRPGLLEIRQLVEGGDFEAVNTWYLGVALRGPTGGRCLRAFHLTDPSRIVIDIQH